MTLLQECFLSGLFCFAWFTQCCKGWSIFFENNLRFLRVSELKGFPNVHSEVGGWKKVFSENSQFWERTEGSSAYPNHSLESDEILKILSNLITSLSTSELKMKMKISMVFLNCWRKLYLDGIPTYGWWWWWWWRWCNAWWWWWWRWCNAGKVICEEIWG